LTFGEQLFTLTLPERPNDLKLHSNLVVAGAIRQRRTPSAITQTLRAFQLHFGLESWIASHLQLISRLVRELGGGYWPIFRFPEIRTSRFTLLTTILYNILKLLNAQTYKTVEDGSKIPSRCK